MATLKSLLNKEPAMVIAGVLAFAGLVMPYVIVPMRRAAGLPTYQWDSNTATNPFISDWSEHGRKHTFDNAELLAKWARADAATVYRYHDPLVPTTTAYPEARERLEAKGKLL